jgi:hypothetical protein
MKTKALILLSIIAIAAISPILLVQAQNYLTIEQKVVDIAQNTADHAEKLITVANEEEALQKIQDVNLQEQLQNAITLYEEGMAKLDLAKEALATSPETASGYALEALQMFREAIKSLTTILKTAGIEPNLILNENQVLSDALARELQRITTLREILPTETPREIFALLDSTQSLLEQANALLLQDKLAEAKTLYLEARSDIYEVYQYLRETAADSNIWRLAGYCERLQERIRERFRYGREQNVDLSGPLAALGYQSETEYTNALSNQLQTVQNQQDIKNAIQQCEQIGLSVQNMENAVNEEITRQFGQQGGPVSSPGSAGNWAGNGAGAGNMGGGA